MLYKENKVTFNSCHSAIITNIIFQNLKCDHTVKGLVAVFCITNIQ